MLTFIMLIFVVHVSKKNVIFEILKA